MKKTHIFVGVVAVIVAICLETYPLLTQSREERVARALAKEEGWKSGWMITTVSNVKHESNRWIIFIECFPPNIGQHAFVDVEDGKVVRYRGGK